MSFQTLLAYGHPKNKWSVSSCNSLTHRSHVSPEGQFLFLKVSIGYETISLQQPREELHIAPNSELPWHVREVLDDAGSCDEVVGQFC
jgi:hypothetical protein